MGSFSSNSFRRNIITLIMIAKITLVSCLAAIAMAAPEPQLGYGLGYGGGVVSSVPAACTPSTEEIEIQSCAPTAETICSTADVVSEEIDYEKRCLEVVNKHCAHIGHAGLGYAHAGLVGHAVKREADAEADAQVFGYGGYAHHAPVAVALPAPVTKTIETPCTEVSTEHCVDVPIVKEVVTPVETCHVVTKVICTPAVHSIPKVTCEAGVTEIVEHPVYAHHGAYLG